MKDERNQNQIIRKDARNCFVESLNDAFEIGKIHLAFATYDLNKPSGQRQTNNIHIYIAVDEFLELCRRLCSGSLLYQLQQQKSSGDNAPLYQSMGGTSAEKLAQYGRSRSDGKSLSRIVKLIMGSRSDFLLIADSGPGETNAKGLIVPKFGRNPENHVAVSMTFQSLSELLLLTKTHYEAWLAAWYLRNTQLSGKPVNPQPQPQTQNTGNEGNYPSNPLF